MVHMISLAQIFRRRWIEGEEYKQVCAFEQVIKYRFRDVRLLKQALSHKSYANENRLTEFDHNERLEFLGDAVLELGISDLLMKHFPESHEGEMSKLRASIVNETALSEMARQIQLGQAMFLGRGEDQCDGREKNSLLADTLEAVLGAVYLDGGFVPVFRLLVMLFFPVVQRATREDINRDYKTKLQEEVQNRFKTSPQYRLADEIGPDHDKTFVIDLMIAGTKVAQGTGKSKKQAEQDAACVVFERLDDVLKMIDRGK